MKATFTLALVFALSACFAQKQNVYFFKNDGTSVSKKIEADYYRVVQEPDAGSNLYNVYEYYANGQKKLIAKSSTVSPLLYQGQVATFFTNGKKQQLATYKDSKLTGLLYEYYPNGKIYFVRDYSSQPVNYKDNNYRIVTCLDSAGKTLVDNGEGYYIGYDGRFKYVAEEGTVKNGLRDGTWKGVDATFKVKYTEHYDNGTLLAGVAIDEAGNKHEYQQRFVTPYYRKGEKALYKFMGNLFNSLREDVITNLNGTAFISFTVVPGGKVDHIEVTNSADESVTTDLKRIIGMSAKGWEPGSMYGMPARIVYTMPFTLKTTGSTGLFD
jgi:antitoxin component YwqK of YwqJK toxin-antitoxin module